MAKIIIFTCLAALASIVVGLTSEDHDRQNCKYQHPQALFCQSDFGKYTHWIWWRLKSNYFLVFKMRIHQSEFKIKWLRHAWIDDELKYILQP